MIPATLRINKQTIANNTTKQTAQRGVPQGVVDILSIALTQLSTHSIWANGGEPNATHNNNQHTHTLSSVLGIILLSMFELEDEIHEKVRHEVKPWVIVVRGMILICHLVWVIVPVGQ